MDRHLDLRKGQCQIFYQCKERGFYKRSKSK